MCFWADSAIENIYYVCSSLQIIAIAVALYQFFYGKKSDKEKNKLNRQRAALDLCKIYANSLQKEINDVRRDLRTRKTNEARNASIDAFNNVEIWSLHFMKDFADTDTAKTIVGKAYVNTINKFISECHTDESNQIRQSEAISFLLNKWR